MDKIFLAILNDRHIDDTFVAFYQLQNAIAQCERWIEEYGNDYEFSIPEWDWQEYWKFYRDAGDDCPKVSVQEIELHL